MICNVKNIFTVSKKFLLAGLLVTASLQFTCTNVYAMNEKLIRKQIERKRGQAKAKHAKAEARALKRHERSEEQALADAHTNYKINVISQEQAQLEQIEATPQEEAAQIVVLEARQFLKNYPVLLDLAQFYYENEPAQPTSAFSDLKSLSTHKLLSAITSLVEDTLKEEYYLILFRPFASALQQRVITLLDALYNWELMDLLHDAQDQQLSNLIDALKQPDYFSHIVANFVAMEAEIIMENIHNLD